MFRLNKGMLMFGIPFLFSVIAVIKESVIMFLLLILAHFLVLKSTKAFRHHENIGMFVIVAISSIPINIYIFMKLAEMGFIFDSIIAMNVLRGVFYYIMLLSVEELIMGVVTRLIWRRQYRVM